MKYSSEIAKYLLLPELSEDKNVISFQKIDWDSIADGFTTFEIDSKPLYAEIYQLELSDPEKIISTLPQLYETFIEDLAEGYVLGKSTETGDQLLKYENSLFSDKLNFYRTLKNVITKQERERIIQELPIISERIAFSISDEDLTSVIKKKTREDLKDKFGVWDKELEKESYDLAFENMTEGLVFEKKIPDSVIDLPSAKKEKTKGKVISFSWMKYAVAASIIIAAGIIFFKPFGNNENIANEIVETKTSSRTVDVIVDQGLGYIANSKNLKVDVFFVDHTERIASIERALNENNDIDISDFKKELDSLRGLGNKYVYNDNQLTIYSKSDDQKIMIVQLDDEHHYVKLRDKFYELQQGTRPVKMLMVDNDSIVEQIEKLIFKNE